MRRLACYLALAVGLGCQPAFCQQRFEAVFLFPEIVGVTDAAENRAPEVASKAARLRREYGRLVAALEKLPAGIPVEYEYVFAYYAGELRAIALDVHSPSAVERMDLLLDDVKIKNDFLSTGYGFILRTRSRVELRVSTVDRSGRPRGGFSIICNPRRYKSAEQPLFSFPKLSPSALLVLPGMYTLQVRGDDGKLFTKDATIGLAGEESELVEILVE